MNRRQFIKSSVALAVVATIPAGTSMTASAWVNAGSGWRQISTLYYGGCRGGNMDGLLSQYLQAHYEATQR